MINARESFGGPGVGMETVSRRPVARTVHWESLRGCGALDVACGLVLARDLPAARVQRLLVKFPVVSGRPWGWSPHASATRCDWGGQWWGVLLFL